MSFLTDQFEIASKELETAKAPSEKEAKTEAEEKTSKSSCHVFTKFPCFLLIGPIKMFSL